MFDKFLKKIKQYSGSSSKKKHRRYKHSSSGRKSRRFSSSGHHRHSPFQGSHRYKRKGYGSSSS
ncbi:hypothetical protein [Aquibacillus rhizosphaerae]|uniref:Uncharacterized protein n=1 Tax=Aquibacillus rhizosphaerae TaxID=3051431 RepID=A0ABT7LBD5_9BACI|nr:hypothetical protein [Aquibacillus sp. LR5S19]MDL4843182.1 hypothetical protein [Aquibacillus sp. LR5S19]